MMVVILACVILMFVSVSAARAAPPLQEPQEGGDDTASVTDSFNLDEKGNNLGTIMSGRGTNEDTEMENPGDDDPNGDVPDGEDPDGDDAADGAVKEHPVASAIAEYFDVDYLEVKTLHENGYGFGVITKAYFFADKFGIEFVALESIMSGQKRGWRKVLNELNAHKNGQDPQEVITAQSNSRGASPAEPPGQAKKGTQAGPPGQVGRGNNGHARFDFTGPGNGNGRGNSANAGSNGVGNGNKGRPSDHPGGGNGRGGNNGNSGGNGNGRGRNK